MSTVKTALLVILTPPAILVAAFVVYCVAGYGSEPAGPPVSPLQERLNRCVETYDGEAQDRCKLEALVREADRQDAADRKAAGLPELRQ